MTGQPAIDLAEPGALWRAVRARSAAALAAGALRPIATRPVVIEDGGVRFSVRVAEALRRKAEERAAPAKGAQFNPFLPPEAALTVGAVGPHHLAVLNKFNVVEQHLLLVTRRFEPQEAPLTPADFTALWHCLANGPALAFYNGGSAAGASQRHKHLQLVPLPLAAEGPPLPMAALFTDQPAATVSRQPRLPFPHRFAALPAVEPTAAARLSEALYREMLAGLGIAPVDGRQGGPYNLLLTRDWLLVVPRRREHAAGISINGLGFAGSLFVRDAAELEAVRQAGPMALLQMVGQ
jgi:ATP adenylyltransferase